MTPGIHRREWLRLGGLSMLGLSLPHLLRADSARSAGKMKSCVLFLLQGGPSQLDIWDPKPNAPAEIRGPFQSTATAAQGLRITEHLPHLAKSAKLFRVVRTMSHKLVFHNAAAYYAITGQPPLRDATVLSATENDYPHVGALVALKQPARSKVPTAVSLPDPIGEAQYTVPGQNGGFLGARYTPFCIHGDPGEADFRVNSLEVGDEFSGTRLNRRRALLDTVQANLASDPTAHELDTYQQRALDLLTSTATQQAFDLGREPERVRDRYGRHKYGQSMLLARRLVEAGVRLVTVYWGGRINGPLPYWDTHAKLNERLKDELLPPFDQCFSAFLEDLNARGLLDTTLVACLGEFGRTPRLGQFTGNGGDPTGRDHWPHCYSMVVAGGCEGGHAIGRSDRFAAYPADEPYAPEDLCATILHQLGVNPTDEVRDGFGRVVPLSKGTVRSTLFG